MSVLVYRHVHVLMHVRDVGFLSFLNVLGVVVDLVLSSVIAVSLVAVVDVVAHDALFQILVTGDIVNLVNGQLKCIIKHPGQQYPQQVT